MAPDPGSVVVPMVTRRLRDETGAVAVPSLGVLLWAIALAGALVDIGGYLLAAARAQSTADAAALAAVSVDVEPGVAPARGAAAWVVTRAGAELESCTCVDGSGHAEVTVSVPVPGVFVPRFGMQRVTATAEAELTTRPVTPPRSSSGGPPGPPP